MTQQIRLATIQKKLAELQNDISALIGEASDKGGDISISVFVDRHAYAEERITSFTRLKAQDIIRVGRGSAVLEHGVYTVLLVEPPTYKGSMTVYLKDRGWVFFDTLAQETTITRVS